MAFTKSAKVFQKARSIMVGGVNSPVRSFKAVGGTPLVIDKGKGAKIYDVDGNSYTDYCLSWGALILGHRNKEVFKAINAQLNKGTSFGTSTAPEYDLAKLIAKYVPSIEKMRFVNSGTEATMSAIRLARGYTGKDLVIKFDGCYHGHVDDLLTKAGSGVAMLSQSSSAGIPKQHVKNTLSLPYNDIEIFEQTLTKYQDKIACVILEPVTGNMGVIVPKVSFIQKVRALTKRLGIVLIFDEVMTGFRAGLGCAQTDLGVMPDMTCLGKIIGGGFPIGCYGGKKEIMECLAPEGGVYQAGTFSGNPIVMAAGAATLAQLNKTKYDKLNAMCDKFVTNLNIYFRQKDKPVHLVNYASQISIRFRKAEVKNYQDAQDASSDEIYSKLFHFLLKNGIYLPPADLESFFVSLEHTSRDLDKLSKKLIEFFK